MTSSSGTTPNIHLLQVGQILRDPRPKKATPKKIGGLVNFYAATAHSSGKHVPFDRGINAMAIVNAVSGRRRPGILISSSPHKFGSSTTPWEDLFAPDQGYVRYLGDGKTPGRSAGDAAGNQVLIDEFEHRHASPHKHDRINATPLIFFRREPHKGVQKGFPRFQGIGVLTSARLITQTTASGAAFANFEFTCCVLSLAAEGEVFDWGWINQRRDRKLTTSAVHAKAPAAWKEWVDSGETMSPSVRRKVIKRDRVPVPEQLPEPGSANEKLLAEIYKHYEGKKLQFESLAAAVAHKVLDPAGTAYKSHGVTRGSGDGGIDFIGQFDVGEGFSRAPLVVLGQAKCVAPGSQANAKDLARTVARLRRGWLGVFVTTGAISVSAQAEAYDDRYPLVLIPGLKVAETVRQMLHEDLSKNLHQLLVEFDKEYQASPRVLDPEQLVV